MGMDGIFSEDDLCAAHLVALREHVLQNSTKWRLAAPPKPANASHALGAEELGAYRTPDRAPMRRNLTSKQQRLQRQAEELAEARKQHEGYPTLRMTCRGHGQLADTVCLYCGQQFDSRERLFTHLRKMIPKDRMVHSWHQYHFRLPCVTSDILTASPLQCPATCCASQAFETAEDLLDHLRLMGVPGATDLEIKGEDVASTGLPSTEEDTEQEVQASHEGCEQERQEETAPIEPYSHLGKCYNCHRSRDTLFGQCGHSIACSQCASALTSCPLCSEQISQKVEVCWS